MFKFEKPLIVYTPTFQKRTWKLGEVKQDWDADVGGKARCRYSRLQCLPWKVRKGKGEKANFKITFQNSILYTDHTSFHQYLSLSVHELSLLLFSKDH